MRKRVLKPTASRCTLLLAAWLSSQLLAADLTLKPVGHYVVDSSHWQPADVAVSGDRAFVNSMDFSSKLQRWVGDLLILDIAEPHQPTLLGSYRLPNGAGGGIAASGDVVYVAAGADGVVVVDVSNPAAPRRKGGYNTSGQAIQIMLIGTRAYVADSEGGLLILDVSNPASPRRLGGKTTGREVSGVFVSGNYAYLAERIWSDAAGREVGTLEIMDISDPARLKLVGAYEVDYGLFSVLVAGNIAYLGGGSYQDWDLVDVSDSANPQHLDYYSIPSPRGVLVGTRAYLANYQTGLRVLDLRDAAAPQELGSYKSEPYGFWGIAVQGTYAYLGFVGGSPKGPGLAVIEIEPPSIPPPSLAFVRADDKVLLSWPSLATGFILERSDELPITSNWLSEPTPPVVQGDQNVVTLESGTAARFFRLRKP